MKSVEVKAEQLSGRFSKFTQIHVAVAAIFGLVSLVLVNSQANHGLPMYLSVFMFFLTITLGGLFWVTIFHLTRSGWSVVVRRLFEHLMNRVGLMALLFIPIVLGLHGLYEWTHEAHVMHDHLLQVKAPYLNQPFFIVRSIVYFIVWFVLARGFFNDSTQQDINGDPLLTARSQKRSTYGILLYAITISFAGIDWIMTLTPHWYSTMFGVYIFAGAALSSLCMVSLLALFLRRNGFLSTVISVEHYHDLGKLIYGFVIFWAYIGFSQYFLIWYANIPEETMFYLSRNTAAWKAVSLMLVFGHFLVPFVLFMSRHMKRNRVIHACIAAWILLMHAIDMVWLVLPTFYPNGYMPTVLDIAIIIALAAAYGAAVWKGLDTVALFAHQGPRVDESMRFENV